ncbi:MAG: iron ABC transporter permease [Ruminococcus sp.]|nr:iron ABC transporter permease [Ruminococcus sp.]
METKRKLRWTAGFIFLLLLAAGFFILNILKGTSSIPAGEVLEALSGKDSGLPSHRIVREIRLPRAAAALLLGGALAVSGFLLQSFFANPIAGPYVLGISSGAKLTVALAMILALKNGISVSSWTLVAASFAGSLLSTGAILLLSGRVKNMAQLIIGGVMIGYICSSVTELAVTFADDANIVNLHNWSMGSFSGADRGDVRVILLIVVPAVILTFMLSKPLGAYQLGESYAENLGVNVRLFRVAMILLSSVLSACVTAFAGPVSFVGVAVPHLMKSLFGTAKPIVIIPASFLGGASVCMMCDLIARTVFAPVELSISTVTALFCAPVVIVIMLKRRKGGS